MSVFYVGTTRVAKITRTCIGSNHPVAYTFAKISEPNEWIGANSFAEAMAAIHEKFPDAR